MRWGKLLGIVVLAPVLVFGPARPARAVCTGSPGYSGGLQGGYWLLGGDGGVFSFGAAQSQFYGSDSGRHPGDPAVGMANGEVRSGSTVSPSQTGGYFIGHRSGEVDFFPSNGSGSPERISASPPGPVAVGIAAASASSGGFYLAGPNGAVTAGGGAPLFGSASSLKLNAPIVGIASPLTGSGYWLVGRDGGVFSFGQAGFYGSATPLHPRSAVVGISATEDGKGYWLVTASGGVYTFGDAGFFGAAAGQAIPAPMVALLGAPNPYTGYWLVDSGGGVTPYGTAPSYGSMRGKSLASPMVGGAWTVSPQTCPSST